MGFIGGRKTSAYYIVGLTPSETPIYMDPHDLRHHNDPNYTCGKLATNLTFEKLNPSLTIAFLLHNRQQHNEILKQFSNIFDTSASQGNDANYVCLEDENEFCIIQEG
jgi:hypothetical protein